MNKEKIGKLTVKYFIIIAILTILSNSIYNLSLPKIHVCSVESSKLKYLVDEVSSIEAEKQLIISGIDMVKIEEIYAKPDQMVKVGDALFKLSSVDIDRLISDREKKLKVLEMQRDVLELKQNEGAEVEKNEYLRTKKNYENNLALYNANSIARVTLEDSEQIYKVAQLNYESKGSQKVKNIEIDILTNQMDIEEKQMSLDKILEVKDNGYLISSPINGSVDKVLSSVGEIAEEGRELIRINDSSRGYGAKITVSSKSLNYFSVNDEIDVVIPRLKDTPLSATIVHITNHGTTVDFDIIIHSDLLLVSDTVNVKMIKSSIKYDMVIPKTALCEGSKGEYYVWRVKNIDKALGKEVLVEKTLVTVIDKDLLNAAIKSGLNYNDQYVLNANEVTLENNGRVIIE